MADERTPFFGLSVEDRYASVKRFELNHSVPMSVRVHFETAKNLYLYAWFVLRFVAVAEQQALASLELALRERISAAVASKAKGADRWSLAKLLRHARDNGLITSEAFSESTRERWTLERARHRFRLEQAKQLSEARGSLNVDDSGVQPTAEDRTVDWIDSYVSVLPIIRNDYAHGSPTLPAGVLRTFGVVCDLINQLFPLVEID